LLRIIETPARSRPTDLSNRIGSETADASSNRF
jgi:hypothetical protein